MREYYKNLRRFTDTRDGRNAKIGAPNIHPPLMTLFRTRDMHPPLVQMALDSLDFDVTLARAEQVVPHVDIFEAGAPCPRHNGETIVEARISHITREKKIPEELLSTRHADLKSFVRFLVLILSHSSF